MIQNSPWTPSFAWRNWHIRIDKEVTTVRSIETGHRQRFAIGGYEARQALAFDR